MKRIAIIDDEPDARQLLRNLLASLCPGVEICGEADSVASAYPLLRQTQPHGVLLDISMEDGTGFDLLDKFQNPHFQVIFTTAHDEFALKAFRYHALDYLLKPIEPAELAAAVDRIQAEMPADFSVKISHLLESARHRRLDKITLNSQEGIVFLSLDQILRLESDGNYTVFHLAGKERHVVARPIKDFEELLPKEDFFRLHQSHLVRIASVKKILKEDGGMVLLENGFKAPIARRRKEEFMEVVRGRFGV